MKSLDRGALAFGTVFTVLGLVFLLAEFGVWRVRGDVLLPVLLIAVGLVLAGSAFLHSSGEKTVP